RRRREPLRHPYRARRVLDVHHPRAILRRYLHGRVCRRGRGAPDQQRHFEILTLHLLRHVHHLIERGRDEPRQADEVCILAARGLRSEEHASELQSPYDLVCRLLLEKKKKKKIKHSLKNKTTKNCQHIYHNY